MKVIYGIGKVKKTIRDAVLAIGVFDGLHLGHQKLIKAAVRRARSIQGPAIVMTFFPHPVQVLQPRNYLPFIVSLPHRLKLIEDLGADLCLVVRFTKRFSRLTAQRFIDRYLLGPVRPREIFVGSDFRFGRDRQGTADFFRTIGRRHDFKVHTVAPVRFAGQKIGSSRIRQLISDGKMPLAGRLLGRPVSVMGKVIRGDGRGKTLGYPTANIVPENDVVLPVGVYAVLVVIGPRCYAGMANVGRRPSFKKRQSRLGIEVHIFRFARNVYNRCVMIEFVEKIRDEKKFRSRESMIAQLKRDERKSRTILQARR